MSSRDLNLENLESYKTLPKQEDIFPFDIKNDDIHINTPIEVQNYCTYDNNKLLINIDINTYKIENNKFPINININIK